MYNSVELSIFTLSSSQSPELFHPVILKLYTYKTIPHFPISLTPGNHSCTFFFSVTLTNLDTLYKWGHIVFLCDWLFSLSVMSSWFICAGAWVRISFIFRTETILAYVYTTFSLSLHPLMDTCFFTFWLL